ncbi:MAG TPA: hypothetical protein VNP73_03725, partial [Actinomycetota bacterium]|nr:hypothetical protein [Actinomycetota bacterium]
GTRDFLVYERAIWKLADRANAMGVPHNQLLSAAARDSYYVWEEGSTHTEEIGYKSAWWVDVWHLPIEGRYVIVPSPLPGYRTLRQAEYSSWLHADPQHLYLQTAEGSGS